MLRELIAWVLNNYLGKYVGNLNTAQLTVALLSGEVELENLPLRPDALRNLGLPLQALSGVVGKIKLQIPVRQFRTAPWCILIENVYVVIGPVNLDEWDADAEEQADLDYKLTRLDNLEAKWRALREANIDGSGGGTNGPGGTNNSYYASSYTGWLNYGTSLVTNIIENLELKIRNVHIRYEDSITITNQRFACGMTIESLSARSCDSNWFPGFSTNWAQNTSSFKLVELESMTFYWDLLNNDKSIDNCLGDVPSNELADAIEKLTAVTKHQYIASPVSAKAHLKRDRSETPLRTRSRPRLVCDLILNEVSLSLNDCQYNQMVECVRGLDDIAKYKRFKLLRPTQSIHNGGAKAWWLYALSCHGNYKFCDNRRNNISPISKTVENIKYIGIYTNIIINPNETLTMETKEFKDKIEKERNFEELKILREICMSRVPISDKKTNNQTTNQGRSMLLQWFPQWWGWYNNNNQQQQELSTEQINPNDLTQHHQHSLQQDIPKDQNQLEDEILNALADSVENNSLLKRDAVFGKFEFILKKGTLDICLYLPKTLENIPNIQLQFENLILNIESRPRSGSHFVGLSLGSVLLKDCITINTEYPDLIKPQLKNDATNNILTGHNQHNHSTRLQTQRSKFSSNDLNTSTPTQTSTPLLSEPLFQLHYERKPLSYNTDYRLLIKSQSLDIVYNMEVIKWLIDFIIKPHQVFNTRKQFEAMKTKTKMGLIKNWETIVEGDYLSQRKTWMLEIDIYAPQIIFVENFNIKNSSVVVIDFGRLKLTTDHKSQMLINCNNSKNNKYNVNNKMATTKENANAIHLINKSNKIQNNNLEFVERESEDEDAFMTPCSTPPGSPHETVSTSNSPTLCTALSDNLTTTQSDIIINNIDINLNENTLHNKIYDCYNMDLIDLQVLVCKGKERWSFASSKGSSTLHVLDRFSISLQAERRIVYTTDPQFPSFTISGTLPKLIAHINEYKISAITTMLNTISSNYNTTSSTAAHSPMKPSPSLRNNADNIEINKNSFDNNSENGNDDDDDDNKSTISKDGCEQLEREASKLVILQFNIDQMSLEVQSRGRSIAELQVSGVKAGYSKRLEDTSFTLSVHGLLLVDAIQSFGPDFELLIASHRHVGMDSISGSLKQSEPTSPNSPGSPDPSQEWRPTSPHTISRALSTLQRTNSATWSSGAVAAATSNSYIGGDTDALITVEILLVSPEGIGSTGEQLQIANIQFNNLDIIANQETIVELMGFARRVFPKHKLNTDNLLHQNEQNSQQQQQQEKQLNEESLEKQPFSPIRTEITFDFHRLNVLVLRALMRDNFLVGRKVGTFTMSEARIHATLGQTIKVEGSLGGLQILDLTPEGVSHQRILSVGKDPLTEPPIGGSSIITNAQTNTSNTTTTSTSTIATTATTAAYFVNRQDDLLNSLTQEIYSMGNLSSSSSSSSASSSSSSSPLRTNKNKNSKDNKADDEIDDNLLEEYQALSFRISKNLKASVEVKIRMGSVWYTHCARFMQELSWCATEFKHYLKNFAKSIREKATDMALGLVQSRSDIKTATVTSTTLPKIDDNDNKNKYSSNVNIKLDVVLDTPVLVLPRSSCSPQVFVAHLGKISVNNYQHRQHHHHHRKNKKNGDKIKDDEKKSKKLSKHKIFTIDEENTFTMDDIDEDNADNLNASETDANNDDNEDDETIIDYCNNDCNDDNFDGNLSTKSRTTKNNLDTYLIDVRNINLFSLDTSNRKGFRLSALPRAEEFYSCHEDAIPVLHDTAIRLEITRIMENSQYQKYPHDTDNNILYVNHDTLQINGSVVRPLNLSLSRMQYEQLLETIENIFKVPSDLVKPPNEVVAINRPSSSVRTAEDVDSPHLLNNNDFKLTINNNKYKEHQQQTKDNIIKKQSSSTYLEPKVKFELPIFIIQLKNELNNPLIQIFFRDFNVNYEKNNVYETNIQVSLHSILMEDLLQDPNSKHRSMVISAAPFQQQQQQSALNLMRSSNVYTSNSCPNLIGLQMMSGDSVTGSLPENLECSTGFSAMLNQRRHQKNYYGIDTPPIINNDDVQIPSKSIPPLCPETPPPSPQLKNRQDNLVLYSSLLIDADCPEFASKYNSIKQSSSIDFNSLNLIISVESWFILLNFFGLLSDNDNKNIVNDNDQTIDKDDDNIVNDTEFDELLSKEFSYEALQSHSNQQQQQQQHHTQFPNQFSSTVDGIGNEMIVKHENSELDISIRSLTLTLIRQDYEIGKANISNAHIIYTKYENNNNIQSKTIKGRLGSISLFDLTTHGGIYRERFLTSGNEALNFIYVKDNIISSLLRSSSNYNNNNNQNNNSNTTTNVNINSEARLKIQMSSVRYVHTKRFVAEIQVFFQEFLQLQTPVMRRIKTSDLKTDLQQRPTLLGLEIKAGSPIILLPLSSHSDHVIVADLGAFSLKNSFHLSNELGIISVKRDPDGLNEILDVMHVDLVNTDLFAGLRYSKESSNYNDITDICLDMGTYLILKKGANLLNNKCHLKLIVERNMDTWKSHNVPDFSVQGTLSKLEAVLDLEQYKLVRGFLSYNLGEEIDDVYVIDSLKTNFMDSCLSLTSSNEKNDDNINDVWTNLSITLDLQDVSVRLQIPNNSELINKFDRSANLNITLACINFIKSSLKIDLFSDSSQDIDLVSQEILISDSRFSSGASTSSKMKRNQSPTQNEKFDNNFITRKNVFSNILQPINFKPGTDSVQAEIHSRKRKDFSKYTILLNNMRLMAILDWLENVRDFLIQNAVIEPKINHNQQQQPQRSTNVQQQQKFTKTQMRTSGDTTSQSPTNINNTDVIEQMELTLNITNSELVFVEKTDQWDTNAIILKSTTIVSFRPIDVNRVASINLNHLEVFSCILGSEEETALSIIDPVTINLDIKSNTLDIQLQKRLSIRLSYTDVKMFTQMLQSLPKQTRKAQNRDKSNSVEIAVNEANIIKLTVLGFSTNDCRKALELCANQLDDAALWLTQNAEPLKSSASSQYHLKNPLEINAIELRADLISICVIDDCKDADVPLLELSLSELDGRQELSGFFGNDYRPHGTNTQINNNNNKVALSTHHNFKSGYIKGIFSSDYYNRALSGWEPLIESWKCEILWNYSLGTTAIQRNRLNLKIVSDNLLTLNITSTIIELYQIVHNNWTQDYYGGNGTTSNTTSTVVGGAAATTNYFNKQGSNCTVSNTINVNPLSYRRRNPFVPFALKNDTGIKLWFTTLLTSPGAELNNSNGNRKQLYNQHSRWIAVESGEIIAFSFGPQHKQRHHDTHKLNLHQVAVRIDGWEEVGPISIDRVGVFYRYAHYEIVEYILLPRVRIVFSVTLEGSAQKLVTVRSALRLINKLDNPMLLKMEHYAGHLNFRNWPDTKSNIIGSNEIYSIPLSHVHAYLSVRPLPIQINYQKLHTGGSSSCGGGDGNANEGDYINNSNDSSRIDSNLQKFNGTEYWNKYERIADNLSGGGNYQFCERSIHWKDLPDNCDIQQELRTCKSNNEKWFRFVATIKRDGYPIKDLHIPGHSIILLPPLRLNNLLPCDLLYKLKSGTHGRISSGETANIHEIDLEEQLELTLTLDNYPGSGQILVPSGHIGSVDTRLRLTDTKSRVLYLRATVQGIKGYGMQISISAPYWLINRTGLPLVFRQEGVPHDSAGQFTENEQARLVSPLMFSFSDPDASPALTIRLGKRYYGVSPPWCQPFNLHKDVLHQQLKSGTSNEIFIIGIEVRRGRGRYLKTSVVTFSPRFQLYNRSSYKLQFAQKYYATTLTDPLAKATFIEAVPDCHLPFHWPRLDKEQELCVRLPDIPDCLWSGSIPIHETQSLYINIRNLNGDMYFLRLEIVLQGATYFLLFGDAQALPPPIRIDNYSDVPMKFYQPACKHQWRTIVRPHSSLAYAFDEPMGSQLLTIEAPGGISHKYSLRELGMSNNLTYENFIYIAFSGTFKNSTEIPSIPITAMKSQPNMYSQSTGIERDISDYDIECQQLVLTVVDGGRVILARKQAGARSQLWRMNKEKQLEHEGSSPPTEPGKKPISQPRYVLDLDRAPQPRQNINLVVRSANRQRNSTQSWHFTEEGRLMCEHSNMCVQARGGFFGLRPGNDVVLGMIVSDSHVITESLVPLEQAIERQKLRPGSGFLSIVVSMDGPIKTIQIKDIKSMSTSALTLDPTWHHVSHILPHFNQYYNDPQNQRRHSNNQPEFPSNNISNDEQNQLSSSIQLNEINLNIHLSRGLGISIISKNPCEELAFITLENITMEFIATSIVRSLELNVGDLQIDNQLFETSCPVMLYTIKPMGTYYASVPAIEGAAPTSSTSGAAYNAISRLSDAMHLHVKLLPSPNTNAVIFEQFILTLRPLTIYLEERLMLRLAIFMGLGKSQIDPATLPDESDYEAQRVATRILAANAKRYYFGDLQIIPSQIRLSVITATKLSNQLSEIKKSLGLTLIKFEDALIEFDKFTDKHHFETLEVYLRAIKSHYKQELKWQAASILGSVDFLGNPMGFASDLSEGVSGLLFEGSVKSLVKNVTHGISNSTAKLTETISGGLGRVVLDEQDTETRQRILEVTSGTNSSTGDHLVAGLKGFGFGLLGGVTSIVKHTYVGASQDGIQGFISGLGKGIVGTVTKPVIGVLDLASETANAVRETSKSSNRILPERKRLPRCVTGAPGGLLPSYCYIQSKGQQHLFLINKRNFTEQFMAYETSLCESRESRLRLLVSTENVWIFSRSEESTSIILSYHLSELITCLPVSVNIEGHKTKKLQHYIELRLSIPSKSMQTSGHDVVKRPRVRCQTEEIAQKASRHINYAKSVYDEREQTLDSSSAVIDN